MQRVSVIIPSFNRAACLVKAVESVLNQSYPAIELIVVDDGSTDHTGEAMRRYGDRLTYLRLERQRGGNFARNRGIEAASGSLICFLDSDDEFFPHKVETVVRYFSEHPACDLLLDSFEVQWTTPDAGPPTVRRNPVTTDSESFRAYLLNWEMRKPTSAISVRRQALLDVGMFDEGMRRMQDLELVLRLSRRHACASTDQVLWAKHNGKDALSYRHDLYMPALLKICRRHPEQIADAEHRRALHGELGRHFERLRRDGNRTLLYRDMALCLLFGRVRRTPWALLHDRRVANRRQRVAAQREPLDLAALPQDSDRVSIIIEWENAARIGAARCFTVLANLAEQIKEQALTDYEIILVSETELASDLRDEIATVIGSDVKRHFRFLPSGCADYYEQKNIGFRASTGGRILFLDSDVVPHPGWLAAMLAAAERPEVRVVMGQTILERGSNSAQRTTALFWMFDPFVSGQRGLQIHHRVTANNVLFSRALFERRPFVHSGAARGACTDLGKLLLREGVQLWCTHDAVVEHPAFDSWRELLTRARRDGRDLVIRHLERGHRRHKAVRKAFQHLRSRRRTALTRWRERSEQFPVAPTLATSLYAAWLLAGVVTFCSALGSIAIRLPRPLALSPVPRAVPERGMLSDVPRRDQNPGIPRSLSDLDPAA